jgi:hypothetical protein
LHPHTLTFRQIAQPTALERLRMDENILPTTILPYETEPLIGVVPFDRTEAFLGRPDAGLSMRGRAWMERASGEIRDRAHPALIRKVAAARASPGQRLGGRRRAQRAQHGD